jgi:curved DNA-binding protein CbpA
MLEKSLTYQEALRVLGLDEGASEEDIRVAYREMAQILHPDKFADSPKLAKRAQEQFKNLNEARDVLMTRSGSANSAAGRETYRSDSRSSAQDTSSGRSSWSNGSSWSSWGNAGYGTPRSNTSRSRTTGSSSAGQRGYATYSEAESSSVRANNLRARLNAIAAAKTQLTAQLDREIEFRRIGYYMLVGGFIALLIGDLFGIYIISGLGSPTLLWGVVRVFSASSRIKVIQAQLVSLEKQQKNYEEELKTL